MKFGVIMKAERLLVRCKDLCSTARNDEEINVDMAYVRGVCDAFLAFNFFTNIEKDKIIKSCYECYKG